MIGQFVEFVVRTTYPTAQFVVSDPEVKNSASIGVLEKLRFYKGALKDSKHGREQIMILEL